MDLRRNLTEQGLDTKGREATRRRKGEEEGGKGRRERDRFHTFFATSSPASATRLIKLSIIQVDPISCRHAQ